MISSMCASSFGNVSRTLTLMPRCTEDLTLDFAPAVKSFLNMMQDEISCQWNLGCIGGMGGRGGRSSASAPNNCDEQWHYVGQAAWRSGAGLWLSKIAAFVCIVVLRTSDEGLCRVWWVIFELATSPSVIDTSLCTDFSNSPRSRARPGATLYISISMMRGSAGNRLI